jgi:hypothetical protein
MEQTIILTVSHKKKKMFLANELFPAGIILFTGVMSLHVGTDQLLAYVNIISVCSSHSVLWNQGMALARFTGAPRLPLVRYRIRSSDDGGCSDNVQTLERISACDGVRRSLRRDHSQRVLHCETSTRPENGRNRHRRHDTDKYYFQIGIHMGRNSICLHIRTKTHCPYRTCSKKYLVTEHRQ